MKHRRRITLIALCMLMVMVFCSCSEQTPQTTEPTQAPGILHAYTQAIKDDIADGLQLSIYYNSNSVYRNYLTYPTSLEKFLSWSSWDYSKLVVSTAGLRPNLSVLRKLDDSVLRPITDEANELYEDVQIYYVFELNGEKILDVVINFCFNNVIVNGVYMEYDPVFWEIIDPYIVETTPSYNGM